MPAQTPARLAVKAVNPQDWQQKRPAIYATRHLCVAPWLQPGIFAFFAPE